VPSAPTHLCRFYVRCFHEILSGVPHPLRSPPLDVKDRGRASLSPTPRPPCGVSRSLFWVRSRNRNLRFPHLDSPFSSPLGTVWALPTRFAGGSRVFTQVAFLFFLEPLGFRPKGFSLPFFSLLMSTFSLLIAFPSRASPRPGLRNLSDFLLRFTERSTTVRS